MKILFLVLHFGFVRNVESAVRTLAKQGHCVHIAAHKEEKSGGQRLVERLAADYSTVTFGWVPGRKEDRWLSLSTSIGQSLDYLRYLHAEYDHAPRLRVRAEERAPRSILRLTRSPLARTPPALRVLERTLRLLDQAIPVAPDVEEYLQSQQPDVVLFTPLVDLGSPQGAYLRAASRKGLRTALAVGSWDHLSSKAILRDLPDLVLVWNNTQKDEAVRMHGVPADRVAITGAQTYDHWFGWQPRDRSTFCQLVGLQPDRPYLLYVGSSLFRGTGQEREFVEDWVRRLRAHQDPELRDMPVLIRPHPARAKEWRDFRSERLREVVLWPAEGANPIDENARADYYDSIYHSAAVVGLNSSALIEAGIVGRPVHTMLVPRFAESQMGTLHFQYLLTVEGGLLHVGESFEDHFAQLCDSLRGSGRDDGKRERFIRAFVRPHGLDVPASPIFAQAVDDLSRKPAPAPRQPTQLELAVRALLQAFMNGPRLARLHPRRVLRGISLRILGRRPVRLFIKRHALPLLSAAVSAPRQIPVKSKNAPNVARTPPQVLPTSTKAAKPGKEKRPVADEMAIARDTVTRLAESGKPIIVGPWLTEVGFELLYWIPFVQWAKEYGELPEERLIVVSRGGVSPWYHHVSPSYEEIFTHFTPEQFVVKNLERMAGQRNNQKHMSVSSFDREIIEAVQQARGLDEVELLHPSVMYNLFRTFWRKQASIKIVESFTRHRCLPQLPLTNQLSSLPKRYVAAKFYSNSSFPYSPENRALVSSILSDLTRVTDVVLLDTGLHVDDHEDFAVASRGRLHTIQHLISPSTNLEVQTRIISGAEAFFGSYGGFSYLAPLYGVDTVAYYSEPTHFRPDHLELAKRVFTALGTGSFVACDTRDLPLLRVGLGETSSDDWPNRSPQSHREVVLS